MATPARIYAIYQELYREAETVREFQVAKGERVSGTVTMLLKGDRAKLLSRWGEEMEELCGVLDGTHDDPYILEATQCFYWASLFAVTADTTWASIDFQALRAQAATCGIETTGDLRHQAERLVAMGDQAPAAKTFLLWCVADVIYRAKTPVDDQWDLDQILEADLQEMKTRTYLAPILERVSAD